jgi:hypothetical protein
MVYQSFIFFSKMGLNSPTSTCSSKKFLGSLSLAIREWKQEGRGRWKLGGEGRADEEGKGEGKGKGRPQFQQQIYAPA